MKQKKDGKKVQNWHRPYNPKYRLGQRAYKLKNEKVSLERELEDHFSPEGSHEHDFYWDYLRDPMADVYHYEPGWDCCIDCYYNHIGLGGETDLCNYNYHKLYERVVKRNTLVISDEKIQKLIVKDLNIKNSLIPVNKIEERLYLHIRDLKNLKGKEEKYVEVLTRAIKSIQNIEIVKDSIEPRYAEFMAKCFTLFSPFWLNEPQTYKKHEVNSILNHVFSKYPYPKFLLNAWYEEYNHIRWEELSFKWISWLLIITQGGSLKKASSFFEWNISNKFQHFLLRVPESIEYPKEACIYAEVLRHGGNEIDFQRIMRNQALVIDPTENRYNRTYLEFWANTVKWLITHQTLITDEESNLILSWAVHRYTENEIGNERVFNWRGRMLRNILLQSRAYQEELNKDDWDGYKYQWQKHNLNWTYIDDNENSWEFIELTSGKELYQESKFMRHCVRTYTTKCTSGSSAIFSLRRNGKRKLTIEVAPQSGRLVQALGKFNRMAEAAEKEIVKLWAETVLST